MARGAEGKLCFAAAKCAGRLACDAEGKSRSARCSVRWPHGLRRGEKDSLCCRAVRWQHGPRCGGKDSLCCRAVRWPHGLRRGGKVSAAARCSVRWPHWPAARRERFALLPRRCAGRTACGAERKIRFAAARCAGRLACGAEGKSRSAAAQCAGSTGLRRRGKATLCCRAVRWQHGPRCGGKALLCVVGERGKTGNILFQNVLFQKNNTKSSQFYGCAPVSQAAGCVLMAWNTAMSNFGSRL